MDSENPQDAQQDKAEAPPDVTGEQVNAAVQNHGDHDRVQMLTLNADGTPRQNNPEIIGDPEVAKQLAREQFAQQAVSAADFARAQARSVPMTVVGDELKPASEAPQDPSIEDAQKEHEQVQKDAHAAADAMVDKLYQGNQT